MLNRNISPKKFKNVDSPETKSGVALLFLVAVLSGLGVNASFGVISRVDSGCSHLVTILQQFFTLSITWEMGKNILVRGHGKKANCYYLNIPMKYHFSMVGCVIGGCFLGNLALDYHLPLPLFFLIKCGNLVASMVVGFIFLNRKYSVNQVFSVLIVTIGLCYSTITTNGGFDSLSASKDVIIGAFLVFLALISTAILGVVQEVTFIRFRDHIDESNFISALLFVPLYYILNSSSITQHLVGWASGGWKKVFIPLIINVGCAHICRLTMGEITRKSSSLTATYAATTYRFSAIIVSSIGQSPGRGMWFGVFLVLVGTLSSFTSEGPQSKERHMNKEHMSKGGPTRGTTEHVKKQIKGGSPRAMQGRKEVQHQSPSTTLRKRKKSIEKIQEDSSESMWSMAPPLHEAMSNMTPSKTPSKPPTRPRRKSLGSLSSPRPSTPGGGLGNMKKRASAPKLSSLKTWGEDDIDEFEFDVPDVPRMRRASSLHNDLELLQSIRFSV